MISKGKILEAALEYTDSSYGTLLEKLAEREAFKWGAHWALQEFKKSLWHDETETPFNASDIIVLASFDDKYYSVLYYDGDFMIRDCHHDDNNFFEQKDIVKWCYLSDILPKEGGEQ